MVNCRGKWYVFFYVFFFFFCTSLHRQIIYNIDGRYGHGSEDNEFMEFLHDCIRDLVCSFDVLCKYPKYKSLLIEDCNNYNGIDWYEI